MYMDEGLDSGPILLQEAFPLSPSTTRGVLEAELSRRGASLLVETLCRLRGEELSPIAQDNACASWSRLLTREMRAVDWRRPAPRVLNQIHALSPSPAVLVRVRGRLVKILRAEAIAGETNDAPGRVIELRRVGPLVLCGEGALILTEVQPEGKRPMSGGDFCRGGGVIPGDLFEIPGDA
jgi:methionyl-tRNA formyltransferase